MSSALPPAPADDDDREQQFGIGLISGQHVGQPVDHPAGR